MSESDKSWRTKDWRVNVYICARCREMTTTVDVAVGVTPFQITCPKCNKGAAFSNFYPRQRPVPKQIPEPSLEWYMPAGEEIEKLQRIHPGTLDYVKRGGLIVRPRTSAQPILHSHLPKQS